MAARVGRPAAIPGPGASDRQRLRTVAGVFSDRPAHETDRLLHERIRLGIMSALSVNPELNFSELRDLLATTDGNLSKHARRLEDSGFIACRKNFLHRKPVTTYRLTSAGRRAFERHLQHLEALIKAARGG